MNKNMPRFIKVTSEADCAAVAALAREIWTEHYDRIVGRAQVDYMLDKFQSAAAIARQIAEGYVYYLAAADYGPAGYFALVPDRRSSSALLSKIYVRKDQRGSGLGKSMLAEADRLCREAGVSTIWLTVNKHNSDSIAWYEHVGFAKTGPIVQDIGGGFVMDDYRMERTVPREADPRKARRRP